jgi:hypothetical protein
MIYAIALLLMIDPLCLPDVLPDCFPGSALPAPVDTERGEAAALPDPRSNLADPSVGKLCGTEVSPSDTSIVPPVAKEKIVEAFCENGNCRVGGGVTLDNSNCDSSGCAPATTRRFPILRRLFRR